MEYISTQKFVRMSPRKIRPVVLMIKKLSPSKAVEILPFVAKKANNPLRKVIMSAIANAKDRGAQEGDLIFKEIQITEGPRLKRGLAISRGRWHPIKKRMSHIRIVLEEKKPDAIKKSDSKEQPAVTEENLKIENKVSKSEIKNKK